MDSASYVGLHANIGPFWRFFGIQNGYFISKMDISVSKMDILYPIYIQKG